MSLAFIASGHTYNISLNEFAQILGVPNYGTCLYTDKHTLTILDSVIDHIHPYETPLDSMDVIHDHLFVMTSNTRRTCSANGVDEAKSVTLLGGHLRSKS